MKLNNPLFVFDLDATITKCETLPLLAREVGLEEQMRIETEKAMQQNIPFAESFARRVELLKDIPIHQAREILGKAPIHEEISHFLKQANSRCIIVTGNIDVWIESLLERLGMENRCYCSKAEVHNDSLYALSYIMEKEQLAQQIPHPFVAIGDGSNDIPLLKAADLAIGFSGVHPLSEAVQQASHLCVDNENDLCRLLERFL